MIVIVIGVNKNSHQLEVIDRIVPSNTKSKIPIILINEIGQHFIATQRQLRSPQFNGETWQGVRIIESKLDLLFNRGAIQINRNSTDNENRLTEVKNTIPYTTTDADKNPLGGKRNRFPKFVLDKFQIDNVGRDQTAIR
ncbi:hypothetical protein KQX54_006627 [Cotesia glomerata]|uniref:Uncharacterized protein n=1 Tax=Cotesia glomerata TaxID=32391 RepID=A0AAV7IQ93_COTGL|nr:hypothetical protein KQX54_006627 [Cotesia glomerata]